MLKKINAILRLLPFDGDKLKLSGLFLAAANVPLLAGIDFKEFLMMIIDNPTKAGLIAALLALVHKVIKAQLPAPKAAK